MLYGGRRYDMIDFSILPYLETGTPASQQCIRRWLGYLSTFIHAVDLIRARPLTGWLQRQPDHTVASVLAVGGEDYCIYLADGREREVSDCGQPIGGTLCFELPAGVFTVSAYSPSTGVYSPALRLSGGDTELEVPVFTHDTLIRVLAAG